MSDNKLDSNSRREAVYDEQVQPLLEQIRRICMDNDIPMLATFRIDDSDEPARADYATTSVGMPKAPRAMLRAKAAIFGLDESEMSWP